MEIKGYITTIWAETSYDVFSTEDGAVQFRNMGKVLFTVSIEDLERIIYEVEGEE